MYDKSKKVSFFTCPVDARKRQEPERFLSLFEVYSLIIGENNNHIKAIEEIRNMYDPDPIKLKEMRNPLKKKLPHIVFGGEFSYRAISGLSRSSDLVILDFDHIGTPQQVENIKEAISQDTELNPVLLFLSPSGDGLKVVVAVEDEITGDPEFKQAIMSLENYMFNKYGLKADKSGKDISRTCYLSYDPNAILLEPQTGFNVVKWTPEDKKETPQKTDKTPLREAMNLSSGPLSDYERALWAVEDIESSGIDITQNYADWVRFGFALGNLGEAGRELFHRISRLYPDYNSQRTDEQFNHSMKTGGVKLETLFEGARGLGVSLRNTPQGYDSQSQRERGVKTGTQPTPVEVPPVQTEFPDLLEATTEKDIKTREQNRPDSLMTGYYVNDSNNYRQNLLIPSGKLTGVAGGTGHGKTLFLMNLLLNVAKLNPDKRFVLFTYEENSDTIIQYLLNIYLNDLNLTPENRDIPTSNRLRLKEYFRGDSFLLDKKKQNDFELRKHLFFSNYIENGRILVKYVDSDSSTLCRQIKYLSKPDFNIGGVFIDYFQCINPTESKRYPTRVEALKSICFELKDIANETGFPVVLACQFNQTVLSPTDIKITNIGEAGDISRILSELWGLWNMKKEIGRELKKDDLNKYEGLVMTSQSFDFNDKFINGMYVKVLKSRFVETESDNVFKFRGLTGKIYPNDTNLEETLKDDWITIEDLPFK